MTIEVLIDLLAAFFDSPEVTSFHPITQGKENTTILVETPAGRVILRLWGETHGYMGTHTQNDIDDEVVFMEFCHAKGIPTPKLFRSKSGGLYETSPDGRSYTVMKYADGDSPQHFTSDMAAQIATTMANMHVAVTNFAFPKPRSWPGTVLEMTNERIERFESEQPDAIDSEVKKAITRYRTLLKECALEMLPRGVIHGDIMWENMKFKDGQLEAIFDFGDCRESYFVEDIAKTLLFAFESPEHSVFGEDGENVAAFLQAYQNIRKLTPSEKQSLSLFFLSRILYQLFGYYAKIAKGETEYILKADAIITRYKQQQAFFARQSYE